MVCRILADVEDLPLLRAKRSGRARKFERGLVALQDEKAARVEDVSRSIALSARVLDKPAPLSIHQIMVLMNLFLLSRHEGARGDDNLLVNELEQVHLVERVPCELPRRCRRNRPDPIT